MPTARHLLIALAVLFLPLQLIPAQEKAKKNKRPKYDPAADTSPQLATPVNQIKVKPGFKVELLYSVPRAQGSWVSMCLDPQGRLLACDQGGGGLYRITPSPVGQAGETKVEKLNLEISEAQGLLWAFDSLYIVVNSRTRSGLYRAKDTDGDGELDKVEQLRALQGGGGEHGPHAVLLAPDSKNLYVVCGNQTKITEFASSRVPPIWGEDHLLPRMPDGNGFMRGVLGPGGTIYQVSPDGQSWTVGVVGFRNEYDAAFNREGDLFTYDADMEWDFNTPWYRPTRVCLATSGAEFGWRNGAGKWPAYYPDSLPAVVNIGPGSPTGVTFGYGAKFPAKYQEALFINDWSYGKLYAVHLEPEGAGYTGTVEEFVSGTPLPLTDMVVRPQDGALYFAIGGRNTQSGLYRVTFVGAESTAAVKSSDTKFAAQREQRRKLEAFHGKKDPAAIEAAWPFLGSADRYLRFAARVAIEHQDVNLWSAKALTEKDPQAAVTALLALARVSGSDPFHRQDRPLDPVAWQNGGVPTKEDADPVTQVNDPRKKEILDALAKLDWEKLTSQQRTDLLRVYALTFNRLARPDAAQRDALLARFEPLFPAKGREVNAELCQLLVYLESPVAAAKTMKLLAAAPTQEEQIEYVRALRVLSSGWTPELRKEYLNWFLKAANYKGGNSLAGSFRNMKNDAIGTLTAAEKTALQPILDAQPAAETVTVAPPRPFVKKWTLEELLPLVEKNMKGRDYDRGRSLFAAANCFACHRFASEGGSFGPDLSGLAGRFSQKDLLESVVDPSKVVSDQYQAVIIRTVDGRTITGRIINLSGDGMTVNTNMLDPGRTGSVSVRRSEVEAMQPSATSMMPQGLLDTLKEDEVLDLLAFLLSRGDRENGMFKQ